MVEQQSTEMNPIEVAIDEMSRKVSELNHVCNMEEVDMIRLQLKLQGSVSVKVGFLSEIQTQVFDLLRFVSPDRVHARSTQGLWLTPGHFWRRRMLRNTQTTRSNFLRRSSGKSALSNSVQFCS